MFDDLWREINSDGRVVVQDYNELEYVFDLIKGCKSYLEVGTAEGKSLYVLSHALVDPEITFIDLGEPHTKQYRDAFLDKIKHVEVRQIFGDSNNWETYSQVKDQEFDVVFIDAGHDFKNVLIDACWYGQLAKKYLIFHDVQMPDVNKAFEWYAQNTPSKKFYRIVNSETYGYGVIEL